MRNDAVRQFFTMQWADVAAPDGILGGVVRAEEGLE